MPNDASLVWECGASLRDLVDDASITIGSSSWDFYILHDDERVGAYAEVLVKNSTGTTVPS